MRITRSLYSLLYKQAIEECSERLTLTSAPIKSVGKHLVIFDLEETFYSKRLRGIGKIHWAFEKITQKSDSCHRDEYHWINKRAWQSIIPTLLCHHDVALLADGSHDEIQIKQALNTLFSGYQRYHGMNFDAVPYFDKKIMGDKETTKGGQIAALSATTPFTKYSFKQMVLVDDQQWHLDSASALGIQTIKAGDADYFHRLNALLDLGVALPAYDAYDLESAIHTPSVTRVRP